MPDGWSHDWQDTDKSESERRDATVPWHGNVRRGQFAATSLRLPGTGLSPMRFATAFFKPLLLSLAAFCVALPSPLLACSGLQYRCAGHVYLAKNHDFMMGEGLLIVNPRGTLKAVRDSQAPLEWRSTFGSVTYNQFGQEHPIGGMNEAGLVVEVLWLEQAQFPPEDARPDIGTLQWVQYQLDTADSVAAVIASDERLRIFDPHGKVHYFITDATGDVAVIEWIGGQRIVHRDRHLPVRAVANDPYALALQCLEDRVDPAEAQRRHVVSHDRFTSLAEVLQQIPAGDGVAFGFSALDRVRHPDFTQFQTVYCATAKTLTMRRMIDAAPVVIDLNDAELFSRGARYVDLMKAGPADWRPLTLEVNRAAVFKGFRQTPFLAHLPDEVLENIARTPLAYQ